MAYFEKNGLKIYYEIKGDPNGKEVVAFFNGVMASASSWENQVPLFEKFGFKIILHDFVGQLLSDKVNKPYTFQQHCEDFKDLLEHLNIRKKIHLVGTSLGGEIGMHFGFLFPRKLKSLSIIDSVSEIDPVMERFILLWKRLAERKESQDFYWGMVPTIYGESYLINQKELLEKRADVLKMAPDSYFEGQIALYDNFINSFPFTHKLKRIKCPSLVVCGEDDILKPPKYSEIIAKNIPRSEYVLIPDCGHVTIFEKPDTLNSLLLGFILKNC